PAAEDLLYRAAALDLNTDGAVTLDEHAVDQTVRADCQIKPAARRVQIANCRGDADAAADVARQRSDTGASRMVVIGRLGEAKLPAGVEKRPLQGYEVVEPCALDRDRAAGAVEV